MSCVHVTCDRNDPGTTQPQIGIVIFACICIIYCCTVKMSGDICFSLIGTNVTGGCIVTQCPLCHNTVPLLMSHNVPICQQYKASVLQIVLSSWKVFVNT